MSKLKNSAIGFLLAWQFFSAVPIKKSLNMNAQSITWMYASLPVVGLLMGTILSSAAYFLMSYTSISNLLLAILLVVGMIMLTGGLHLDGFIDLNDAYFSYGEKEKRLEILDDPRTGAFGVISVVSLLLVKLGFVYELLEQGHLAVIPFIVLIPYTARLGMLVYFISMRTSKQTGLAAYFKQQVVGGKLLVISLVIFAILSAIIFSMNVVSYFILVAVMLLAVLMYRHWSYKHFGGMSGDLLGALGEGLEVLLWIVALLCI